MNVNSMQHQSQVVSQREIVIQPYSTVQYNTHVLMPSRTFNHTLEKDDPRHSCKLEKNLLQEFM